MALPPAQPEQEHTLVQPRVVQPQGQRISSPGQLSHAPFLYWLPLLGNSSLVNVDSPLPTVIFSSPLEVWQEPDTCMDADVNTSFSATDWG